jgi:hypothetical protein
MVMTVEYGSIRQIPDLKEACKDHSRECPGKHSAPAGVISATQAFQHFQGHQERCRDAAQEIDCASTKKMESKLLVDARGR